MSTSIILLWALCGVLTILMVRKVGHRFISEKEIESFSGKPLSGKSLLSAALITARIWLFSVCFWSTSFSWVFIWCFSFDISVIIVFFKSTFVHVGIFIFYILLSLFLPDKWRPKLLQSFAFIYLGFPIR